MEGVHLLAAAASAGDCDSQSSTSVVAGADKQPEPSTSTECTAVESTCTATAGSGVSGKKSTTRSTKPKIKRPMNAFMVWSSLERKRLAVKEPSLHNTQLSIRLGQIWKMMTEEEKTPFRQEALKLKQKLMEEHPDYKYRPRRRKLDSHLKSTHCLFASSSQMGSVPYHDTRTGSQIYATQISVPATYPQVHSTNHGVVYNPLFINSPPYYTVDPNMIGSNVGVMTSATTTSIAHNGLETPPCSPSPYVTSTPVQTYAMPPASTATQSCSSPLESRPVTSPCVSGSGNSTLCHIQPSPPHLSPPPLSTTQQPPFRATPPLLAQSPTVPPAPTNGYNSYQQYDWYNYGSTVESTPVSQPAYVNVQVKPENGYTPCMQAGPPQHPYSNEMMNAASEPLKSGECGYETVTPNPTTGQPCINYPSMYGLLTPDMTPSAGGGSQSFF